MLHCGERRPRPGHAVARFQQRLIVGPPVVCDQRVELAEVLGKAVQQARFLALLAHEELHADESQPA